MVFIRTRTSTADETKLPPIENFYNTLIDEPLSVEDYQRAQDSWTHYKIQKCVLLLADVFQHFRQQIFNKHALDCLYFHTLPSLAWSMALKHMEVE